MFLKNTESVNIHGCNLTLGAVRHTNFITFFDKTPSEHSYFEENYPTDELKPTFEFLESVKEPFQKFSLLRESGIYIDSFLDRRVQCNTSACTFRFLETEFRILFLT